MTNEEIIERINSYIDCYEVSLHAKAEPAMLIMPKDYEAFKNVVKILKEPQPTKLRPITSEGAYVLDVETGDVMTNGEYERRHAHPQIKKGEWIDGYCSECGKSCLCDGWGIDFESKFCPNCGSYNGGSE